MLGSSKTMLEVRMLYVVGFKGSSAICRFKVTEEGKIQMLRKKEEEGEGNGKERGVSWLIGMYELDCPSMQRSAAQSIPIYAAMDIYYKQYNDGSHTETRSSTQWRFMETEKGRRTGKVKEGEAKGTVQ